MVIAQSLKTTAVDDYHFLANKLKVSYLIMKSTKMFSLRGKKIS